MAEPKSEARSLEARVAELEDKLAKVSFTEDELRTYEKVSAALGSQAALMEPALPSIVCRICTTCRVCGGCRSCGCRPCRVVALAPQMSGWYQPGLADFGDLGD